MTFSFSHKIDALNRVLLPKELLAMLGWERGDTLSLRYDEEAGARVSLYLLAKYTEPTCFNCASVDIVITVDSKAVCGDCLKETLEKLQVSAG
ncbi:MAG: AbrB/MazE/SpoVT family DNA-binding domain-containing protein [Defluviitaleaceae bacterium]|nr:AbrB/MazE/SpoVT family DNA-binding domain-containing protein [Defluviitaleaceae bacterium]